MTFARCQSRRALPRVLIHTCILYIAAGIYLKALPTLQFLNETHPLLLFCASLPLAMSTHGAPLPDISVQRADINSQLNATLLGIFMMGTSSTIVGELSRRADSASIVIGMYTIIYFGTLYICRRFHIPLLRNPYCLGTDCIVIVTRKRSPGKVVISAISLLYVLGVIEYSFEWTFMQWFFLKNGETREEIFTALLVLPRWLHVMNNIFAFAMLTLADGLLVGHLLEFNHV